MRPPESTMHLLVMSFFTGRLTFMGERTVSDVVESLRLIVPTNSPITIFPEYAPYLNRFKVVFDRLRGHLKSKEITPESPIDASDAHQLSQTADELMDQFFKDRKYQMVLAMDTNETIEKLKKFRATLRNASQQNIADDTIRCLEAGAYRAATVMAWSLTYDHFRRWIFSTTKRLAQFNAQLTSMTKRATTMHDPITRYEDFEEHGEFFHHRRGGQGEDARQNAPQGLDQRSGGPQPLRTPDIPTFDPG